MRKYLLFILTVVLISCSVTRYNRQEVYDNEISRYGLIDGDTLVDIGCETGFHDNQIAFYYPHIYFVLEDIDTSNLAIIKRNIASTGFVNNMQAGCETIVGGVNNIPLASGRYKKILCRKTLHEFENPDQMINEFKRILIPGGEVIIAEINPKYPGQRFHDCVRPFLNRTQIMDLFVQQGFTLKSAYSFTSKKTDLQNGNIIVFAK
ncbi:class I SAM-dependent methyltransferase [Ferruginibacter paludis]|uniref:class I SAM-dependent methyltransferase n=1 Tax=Ferruginibacter paludis TaxID=1310417 RepID=UPI0025B2B578|nr:class I SAM-dependent methyltransferase [Ferruginibacter paludis]MDN3658167.1 class I SAM-dependent methyltransferase [Ferruginibacter paludis]